MKKAGIFTLTLILIVAMFTGCRRQTQDTTMSTNTTKATQTTTKATVPTTASKAPSSSTGVIPEPTDLMPSGTDTTSGTQMPHRHRGPNY